MIINPLISLDLSNLKFGIKKFPTDSTNFTDAGVYFLAQISQMTLMIQYTYPYA
jgi:hypothetical protein